MAGECVPDCPDPKEMGEDDLWELINDNRHRISLSVRPCMLIPYLRQARVLTEMDEDEVLSCQQLTNRSMRTSHMLDLLRTQGKNGAIALLESLMIHYPSLYTQVTGRKPSTEPSGFSGLIKYSELTEYLVRAVTGMQKELQEARKEACRLNTRCASVEAELNQVMERGEDSRRLKNDRERLLRQMAAAERDITKLKDEKCDLYVRYTSAVEEKSNLSIRNRDLNLQVYQLQSELRTAHTESDFQRERSPAEIQQLREEISTLQRQLMEAEKFAPAREDILAQDLADAMDGRMELVEQLRCCREENESLLSEREKVLEQNECMKMQVKKLSLDVEMYQKKCVMIQSQLGELQAERDHAYLSRDEAQAQIARSLAEKDTLRSQLVELEDKVFTLRTWRAHRDRLDSSSRESKFSWESIESSSEEPPPSPPARPKLCRMAAINPASIRFCNPEFDNGNQCSIRSRNAEPPCPESLRRREEALLYADNKIETDSLLDCDFVFIPNGPDTENTPEALPCGNASFDRFFNRFFFSSLPSSLSRAPAPPFLLRTRPKAMRVTDRTLTISFQGKALLSQLTVVGGNKTGMFVDQVTEGSHAHAVGISPGAQILEVKCEQAQQSLRMVLEDSTLEEALWALGQVRGFCHLSLRPNQDAYEKLLQQVHSGKATSGDSFYVRVNMSLPGGASGALAVSCNDILHVTDTRPVGTDRSWRACHVHPCQLLDLQAGTLPNYYRAQRQLIRDIEDMSFQPKTCQKVGRVGDREKQKAVRIVSTGRQGRNPLWVSVDNSKTQGSGQEAVSAPRGCVTLMPYTLVTPHYPPVCRPVLLLPTILGRLLDKKLAEWQGFQLCEPEELSSSEHAARSEVLEDCEQGAQRSYTLQSVERVMKQGTHCVLPLGLDCVRRLQRAEIFPIIVFIAQSKRSASKLRSKLHRHSWSEEQLLECSRSEEPLLDKLPCLYRSVSPDSWCDSAALLTSLRTIVWEEQKKIVWVEPDLM
ncbi:caspase recruitment domain-containing protein 14 [Aplochiton taeniatus]